MCIARTPSTTEFGFTPDNKTEAGTPRLRPLSLSPQRHERIFLQLSVPRRPRCHCLSWAKSEVSRTTSGLLHPCFLDSILSRSCGLLIRYRHMCRCGNAMVCMRLNTLSDMHGFDVCISISSAGLGLDCNAKFLSGLVPDRLGYYRHIASSGAGEIVEETHSTLHSPPCHVDKPRCSKDC